MADNLLEGLVQTSSVLDSLVNLDENSVETNASPQYIGKTARLAAMGDADVLDPQLSKSVADLTETYSHIISVAGDNQLRTQAAAKQREERINSFIELVKNPPGDDPEIGSAAYNLAVQSIQEDAQRDQEDALERAAVNKIRDLAVTDRTQAAVMLQNMELGTPEDIRADILTKELILEREIQKAVQNVQDQGWMRHLADFVMGAIPLDFQMSRTGNVDFPGLVKQWYDNILPGERQNAERSGLWNMPSHEYSKYVREQLIPNLQENVTRFGYTSNTERLQLLSELQATPPATVQNIYAGIDVGIEAATAGFGKMATDVASLLIRGGARKQASELTAQALVEGAQDGAERMTARTGMSVDEVAAHSLPSAVNPHPILDIPLAGETQKVMEQTDELIKALPEALPSDRFVNEDELIEAIEKTRKRIETEYNRPLANVQIEEQQVASGSKFRQIELTLGTKTGSAFGSKKAANRYLSSLGDVGEVVQDESGGWFVKLRRNMPETGFYNYELKPTEGRFLGLKTDNPIFNTILNSRLLNDEFLANLAQSSGNRVSKVLKSVVKPASDRIAKLPKDLKRDLAQVMVKGEKEGTWYTVDELQVLYQRAYQRAPTQQELDVYHAVREYNDIEWRLRNDDTYISKLTKGLETASLELPNNWGTISRRNALVNRVLSELPKERVYNVSKGIHYTTDNPLTQETLEQLKAEGYVLVRYEDSVALGDGTKVRAFLVRGKDAKFEPLRRDQLPYRPGGHRFYTSKYFSKQAVKTVQPDTGDEFLDSPNTYMTGTKAEVDWWNGKMETARLAYKEILSEGRIPDPDVFDEIFEGKRGLPSGEEFIAKMESGEFRPDVPFRTMYDREMPDEYSGLDPEAIKFIEDDTGFNGYLRTNGRMYYSKKGEQLKDWRGDDAPTLDPFETINKSLKNIANLSSFTDYKLSAVERWVNTYKQYLSDYNPNRSALANFTAAQMKREPQFARIRQAAEKQRQIIRRTIGWKTDNDMAAQQMHRQLIEWINGDNPEGVRNLVAEKYTNWWDNNNPVAAMRAFAFDLKLGLFNPVQLMLQMSTTSAAIALSPKFGSQAVFNIAPMFLYTTKSGTEHMLDEFIKRGVHKSVGFTDPKEYKAFMRAMKQSGFLDVSGTHGLIQNWGVDAAASNTGNTVQWLRDAGRIPFNIGETTNRSVAMTIAWRETRQNFPQLRTNSPEFLRRWQGRSEDYSMSMSSQSSAWWQQGVMSIPTQFWSYQMRMIEAMLGNQFTPSQRVRLALSQLLLYGSAGLPIIPLISEKIKGSTGESPDIGTVLGFIDRGLVDNAIYAATGADVQVGKRLSTGPWLTDTVKDFLGMSQYGEKSFAELVGGATGSTLFDLGGSVLNALKDIARHSSAESGGDIGTPISRQAMIKLFTNVSTLSIAHRAWMVHEYGNYVSNKGQVLASDIPPQTAAFILAFGAQPGKLDELTAMREFLADKNKTVAEAAKMIELYRTKMLTEPDNAEEYAQEINLYVRLLPPDIRQKALARAHKNVDPSLYDAYAERIERARAEEEAIQQNEQGQ